MEPAVRAIRADGRGLGVLGPLSLFVGLDQPLHGGLPDAGRLSCGRAACRACPILVAFVFSKKKARLLLLQAALLFFALGAYNPVVKLLAGRVPFLNLIRYPVKLVIPIFFLYSCKQAGPC